MWTTEDKLAICTLAVYSLICVIIVAKSTSNT